MTRSLEGVFALNALFLVVGLAIVWGVCGWRRWSDLFWFGGIAYVCGLAAVCVLGTLVLVFGGSMSTATILAIAAGVTATSLSVGRARRRPLPERIRPQLPSTPWALVALAPALLVFALLAELYRVARIAPLTSWDASAFWMTKAKAIYFYGGLDEHVFRTAAWPSYPIFVPTLSAMNFRFMDSADTTTLAVQWWLLCVALVWAGAGLLRRIAPATVTWLFLLMALVIPEFDRRLLERTADWPLDILFALAALALLGWILTRETWRLWTCGLLLAAVIETKREGMLLAVCLVLGGIAASGWRNTRSWFAIAGVAVLAYLPNIPWRIWWTSRHLGGDTPPGGLVHATIHNANRIGPAFHLVVHLLFNYRMWLGAAPIALVAAALCLWLPERRAAIFFLVVFVLGVAGWTWENWAYSQQIGITPNPGINPTPRTVGSLVYLSLVTAPVLIGQLLGTRAERAVVVPTPS